MLLAPPGDVLTALELLSRQGFQAYLAGGCVRDAVLGACAPHPPGEPS